MSRAIGFPEPWLTLARHHGGVQKLAAKIGVKRLALYRWANGKASPNTLFHSRIIRLAREAGIETARLFVGFKEGSES